VHVKTAKIGFSIGLDAEVQADFATSAILLILTVMYLHFCMQIDKN
jgi:hypothetical protein